MNRIYAGVAVLAFVASACAPDAPDNDSMANQAEQDDRQMAQQPVQPQSGQARQDPARYGETAPGGMSTPSMSGTMQDEVVGMDVVDSQGEELGNVDRVVRNRKSQEILAVIELKDAEDGGPDTVVVPMNAIRKSSDQSKVELRMSRGELNRQPDADSSDYVDVDEAAGI